MREGWRVRLLISDCRNFLFISTTPHAAVGWPPNSAQNDSKATAQQQSAVDIRGDL